MACLFGCPRAVGVDHDRDTVAGRFTGRADLGFLGLVQLDVAVAFGDRLRGPRRDLLGIAILQQAGVGWQAVAARATQQAIERQVRRLAGNVP